MKAIFTSIFDLFKIGPGPSSSHTIGPMKAGLDFKKYSEKLSREELEKANAVKVLLYGSLSATASGHGTDRAVAAGLMGCDPATCDTEALQRIFTADGPECVMETTAGKIHFGKEDIIGGAVENDLPFRNTLIIQLLSEDEVLAEREYYSIGGGFIRRKGEKEVHPPEPPYKYSNMEELKRVLSSSGKRLSELMLENEKAISGLGEKEIFDKLKKVFIAEKKSVERGLAREGLIPGSISLARKAKDIYEKAVRSDNNTEKAVLLLNAYAIAASEENASGHRIVTAPTSGAAGVMAGIVYMLSHDLKEKEKDLLDALMASAAVGFIVKNNASISGAEVGCQGEIGVASAMGAALLSYLKLPEDIHRFENAAEIALEHHLGLTCDPVGGYVQIPCIERNAVGAVTAYNAYLLALSGDPSKQKVHFDQVVEAMLETGRAMSNKLKETSLGGLAVCKIIC